MGETCKRALPVAAVSGCGAAAAGLELGARLEDGEEEVPAEADLRRD